MFYKLIRHISKADIADGARDFRLMKRPTVDAILSMREYNRFSKGIFGWVGFKTKWLPYVNVERVAGETKWSFFSLMLYSIDGIQLLCLGIMGQYLAKTYLEAKHRPPYIIRESSDDCA